MGSRQATLNGDADEGHDQFEFGDETYERTLTRAGCGVSFDGEGYLDNPAVADLFAFLLETNQARQAVVHDGDRREIIL